ncbi:hypothetical protein GCAAIG_00930 [Candidatus Electronema halotolerans]
MKKIVILFSAMLLFTENLFAGTYKPQSNGNILYYPNNGSNPVLVYQGTQQALALIDYNGEIITAFSGGGIYRSPDGQNLGGGGRTYKVYKGTQTVKAMTPCRGGVVTAFSGAGIYFSPDGQNLGGGGKTQRVYDGTQTVKKMICENGTGLNGSDSIITTFSGGGVYKSPDGQNLGGGGKAIRLN